MPCPHSNSGKRTLAYTATKLFNDLSSDLKEFSISSSPLIFKFLPSSRKSKLRSLFFSRLSSAEHLEDLLCSTCRYSIHCHCFFIVLLQPLLRLLIYIYVYMYTCSFIVHILPPFVDLYIMHYVSIAYSTLYIVSFVYTPNCNKVVIGKSKKQKAKS